MKEKVGIGVIGAGRIARVHAANIAQRMPEARLVSVCDVLEEAARACAADFGIPKSSKSHRAVLDDPSVNAVLICSSTDTHSQMMEEAAAAGKHIFCEKPIDFDLARIDAALAVVAKAKVKLQIGFNRRFDHNFQRVRKAIAEGAIGKPYILRITSRDPGPPPMEYVKRSGGMFLDMMIHDFDMSRFLMGCEAVEVSATAGVLVDPEIGKAGDVDTALVTMKFSNGALCSIDNCRKAVFGYDQRVEVLGSDGMVSVDNDRPNTARLSTAKMVQEDLPLFFFLERYNEAYAAELKEFIRCVRDGAEPPVSGRDGRVPVVMAKAALLSYQKGRPVKLSEIS